MKTTEAKKEIGLHAWVYPEDIVFIVVVVFIVVIDDLCHTF